MVRILDLAKVAQPFMPSAKPANKKMAFQEKLAWSVAAVFTYLVLAHFPLFGVASRKTSDAFGPVRSLVAAGPGSLAELGVLPILTARIVMQLAAGAKLLAVDLQAAEDRRLFNAATKALAVGIAVVQALACVASGMYGSLGVVSSVLVLAQLVAGSLAVIALDDLVAKGNGVGVGVNLFVCASIAETVLGGFFRPSLFDVARMVTTLALLAAIAYAVGCGTRFQLKYRQVPSGTSLPPPPQYPIRLLYSLHMPLLITAALLAHVALATQVLFRLWPGNPLAAVTGTWTLSTPEAPASVPTGGLAYWLSPPASTWEALGNPFRTLFYGAFLFAACTMAAEAWAASAGPAAREEARKIDEKGLTMQGCTTRADIAKRLSAAITASIPLGGAALAVLAIAGDVLGVIGSGAALVLMATTSHSLVEAFTEVYEQDPEARKQMEAYVKGGGKLA